jgi:putative DNA-invertase from lambdoid prophage Rac
MRTALYLRVSTRDQHPENQRPELERFAAARGLELVRWFEEKESTRKTRPIFAQMMQEARQGQFRVLLVWRLDRFGRSLAQVLHDFAALQSWGVQLVSLHDPWLDSTGPMRNLLLSVLGGLNEFARELIRENTIAGVAAARARGMPIGRPRVDRAKLAAAASLVASGWTKEAAAKARGVKPSTLRDYLRSAKTLPLFPPPADPRQTTIGGAHE